MTAKNTAAENLKKDKKVLGKNWTLTYNGFFGNEKNLEEYAKIIIPYFSGRKKVKILYPCSASGLLGEKIAEKLKEHHIGTELTLVDISKEHLSENKNSNTRKICGDFLETKLDEKFDLIIMRSSLDYFPEKEAQVEVLRKIAGMLNEGGLFFNQPASARSPDAVKAADEVYNSTKKIGQRHFQYEKELYAQYEEAGLTAEKISEGPELVVTEKEHLERYGITEKDIKQAQEIIKKRNAIGIETTKRGYTMRFFFPIYVARKK